MSEEPTEFEFSMPEEALEILSEYKAAERGDGYWKERKENFQLGFWTGLCSIIGGAFSSGVTFLLLDAQSTDPSLLLNIVWSIFAVLWVVATLFLGVASVVCIATYFKMVFHKQYARRRTPEEEVTLQDRLTLAAVELDRQVKACNKLVEEIELQEEMEQEGIPTDIDLARARLIAQALREELEPKLRQLAVLIKRRNRKAEGEIIDLAAMHEVLGDRHSSVLAEIKTQHELGGDPAVATLHQAVLLDQVNAELGDARAVARQLALKRQVQ